MAKKKKHAGGRPTKYKPEYCEDIVKYFDIEYTKEVEVCFTYKNGDTKETTELRAENLQFLSGFARSIGVCRDTLDEWCKVYPEFSDAYKKAKELQREHLITCGLQGLFPAAAFIFTAKNLTDMRDKTEIEHGATDELSELLKEIHGGKGVLPSQDKND
ncbi:MAG: terminase small subunit [Phycisphaerae bacterium]|nr:terminase small subunit [Phycisphaerae bacterium]